MASAPGKIILVGEHAVVYGQPALAVPVTQVQATATITTQGETEIWIETHNLSKRYRMAEADATDPLATAIRLVLERHAPPVTLHAFTLRLNSSIPFASGLGSGAAVCTATVRALAEFLGVSLSNAEVSALVFETEKLLHGTPSGIDNTVIAYNQPVYFIKGQPPLPFTVARPFLLLIADTGLPSPTKIAVGDVRARWQAEPDRFNALFAEVGALARETRALIENGEPEKIGPLLNRNHELLRALTVSCAELDTLVTAAQQAGALGAKLSGGGRGGNLLALVTTETSARVETALRAAGAKRVLATTVAG